MCQTQHKHRLVPEVNYIKKKKMKELLKNRQVQIIAGVALLIGILITWIISASADAREDKKTLDSMTAFIANNPNSTASQLLGVYNTATS